MADDKEQFAVSSGSEPADSEEELSDDDNGPKPPVPSEKLEPSAKLGIRPGKAAAKVSKGGLSRSTEALAKEIGEWTGVGEGPDLKDRAAELYLTLNRLFETWRTYELDALTWALQFMVLTCMQEAGPGFASKP